MFNIAETVRVLRDAEAVSTSSILNDDEKEVLLRDLRNTIIDTTVHGRVVHAALKRLLPATDQEQGRKAEGVEDAPTVVAESPSSATEAPEGQAEGVEDTTEDAGRVPSGSDQVAPVGKPTASKEAPALKPRAKGKAR